MAAATLGGARVEHGERGDNPRFLGTRPTELPPGLVYDRAHAVAYRLMHASRTAAALVEPAPGRLQLDTLRLRLLEVAAQVTASVRVRRILVRLPRVFPLAAAFGAIAR